MTFDSVGGNHTDAGAVNLGGFAQAVPATISTEDAMAASIVRIQRELEEAQAQIALYEAERGVLANELHQLREEVAKHQIDEDDYVQLTPKGRALLKGLQ